MSRGRVHPEQTVTTIGRSSRDPPGVDHDTDPQTEGTDVAVTTLSPEGLPQIDLYHHVSVATGTKLVSIAGQVALDAKGATVGVGDYAAQVEQAYLNVATALSSVGGRFTDVVRVTMFIVNWTPDKTPLLLEGVARASARFDTTHAPPFTAIGVSALAGPDLLVEVEATAMLD